MIKLVDYKYTSHSELVIGLFRKIYPEWNEEKLSRIAYSEKLSTHVLTKLVYADESLVGQVNLFNIREDYSWVNIGYHLDPKFHGRGIGEEMVNKTISGIRDILVIQTTLNNVPSCRIAISLGFVELPIATIPNEILPFMKFTGIDKGICYIKKSAQQGDAPEPPTAAMCDLCR